MYGKKNLEKIDDVRIEIFMEKCKPKTDGDKISCTKKLDASMMLPCERVLLNKIRRTKFVAKILKVIYHQAHLILYTNVKNMVSTVYCFCRFLISSFCCFFDMISA